jgi:hypothetical protein
MLCEPGVVAIGSGEPLLKKRDDIRFAFRNMALS